MSTKRDRDENPYSKDEARIASFFFDRGAGGGDDPIGAILAGYAWLASERIVLRAALQDAQLAIERMSITSFVVHGEKIINIIDAALSTPKAEP